jgi:hypothetical protein
LAIQLSVAVRNARLAAIWATIGPNAQLLLLSGTAPANCSIAATGTLLATLLLPSVEENAPSSGSITIASGPWTGTCSTAGTAGYFRVYDSAGVVCHAQGTCGISSSDLSFDNTVLTLSQSIQITGFTVTEANA